MCKAFISLLFQNGGRIFLNRDCNSCLLNCFTKSPGKQFGFINIEILLAGERFLRLE